ncbi:DUF5819 family protein [Streptomyces sp. NPDC005236]|uniref:DUF5819 family protein n=1 Tax=Streptomyces sp. NPDC005236 TaxID=3157028 RepID=UPI00339FF331
MDAKDEGSKREPGSVAPEGGAPGGATGGTPLPGPRPAEEEAATDEGSTGEPRLDAPGAGVPPTGAEVSPESGGSGPEAAGSGPEPEATGSDAGAFAEYPAEDGCPGDGAPVGLAALSLGHQIVAALALAAVAVAACAHLGMVFLHVAPSNTVTKQHGRAIDDWIYPEFEQNWKLFAPNPLQQDIAVQVRALVRAADGTSRETGWYDLSALDGLAIDGNPVPSHTQQNELRRAWDFYAATHDGENRPVGLRGDLSERYLGRIGVLRLDREHAGGEGAVVERVQFRSLTTDVPPPRWSDEKVSGRPVVRELPWWAVPGSDRPDAPTEASAR